MDQALTSVVIYLGMLNVGVLLLAFTDKLCVIKGVGRPVSGWVFLALSAIGASVGAKLAQGLFLHKVLDFEFTNTLNLICIFQIILLCSALLMLSVDMAAVQDLTTGPAEEEGPTRFGPGVGEDGGYNPFG